MKAAPGRRIGETGRRAFKPLALHVIADARQAGDQVPGVGMKRIAKYLRRRGFLDQAAGIHDAEPVGEMGMHAHVVGHEQHRRADLALDAADHAEHVLLHHDVERGGGLVGDDEVGTADGGERDGRALAHAA